MNLHIPTNLQIIITYEGKWEKNPKENASKFNLKVI